MEIDNLEEGEYYLFVELPDMKENKSFVVTSYGASEAEFLADEADKFSKRQILSKIFLSKALQGGKGVTSKDMSEYGAPNIKKYTCINGEERYLFVLIHNATNDKIYQEKCTFDDFRGLAFLEPEKGKRYQVDVKPNDYYAVMFYITKFGKLNLGSKSEILVLQ